MTSSFRPSERAAFVQCSGFSGGCPGDPSLSVLTPAADMGLAYWYIGCLVPAGNKGREVLSAVEPGNLQSHRQTPEGARDYELLN